MPRLLLPSEETDPPHVVLPEKRRRGAWEVAYVDLAIALMALFIVLWMMNVSDSVKHSGEGCCRDPRGHTSKLGAGPASQGEGLRIDKSNVSRMRPN
jgi:chemotaxis protein MotB